MRLGQALLATIVLTWLGTPSLARGGCPDPPSATDHGRSLTLHDEEQRWLRFVGEYVIPKLRGYSPRTCVSPCKQEGCTSECLVALGSWWGLKEGVFDPTTNKCGTNDPVTGNPFRQSCCSKRSRCATGHCVEETWLDPVTGVCPHGRPWQVGLAGVQVPNFRGKDLTRLIKALGTTPEDLLSEVAALAGYAPPDPRYLAIVQSRGVARRSWLLRHPVIGLLLVARNAGDECFTKSKPYCWGQRYATDQTTAEDNIRKLQTFFAACTPPTTTTTSITTTTTLTGCADIFDCNAGAEVCCNGQCKPNPYAGQSVCSTLYTPACTLCRTDDDCHCNPMYPIFCDSCGGGDSIFSCVNPCQ